MSTNGNAPTGEDVDGSDRRQWQARPRTRSSSEIGSDYAAKYGFHNGDTPEDYFFKSGRGLSHELVEMISEHKNEPDWMRKFRHSSLDYFNARPLPTWGGDVSEIDFENMYYYIKPTENQADSLGGPAGRHQGHLGQAGHPRGREGEARRRRRRPVRVRGRLPQDSGAPRPKQGVIFLDMDSGLREHEELVKQYFGTIIPLERQQVRRAEQRRLVGRLVHLRPEGRQDRAAAPGLLPDQRREHGPVRAHADHRRRGRLRALRRGLHRADLLERLAALGGRRDRREEGRPLPLHDDPELVEQRLQPRHQARRRLRGRDDGVGRREPRLEADDEVPRDLADGPARPRRGALDRVRRRRPAPGRGRQGASTSRRTRPR